MGREDVILCSHRKYGLISLILRLILRKANEQGYEAKPLFYLCA